jgi:peptidoglycan/xylan/chitin deacetylase (PgdA/CDA1 family)
LANKIKMKTVSPCCQVIVWLLLASGIAAGGETHQHRTITVVFRLDDVSEKSDAGFERQLLSTFRAAHIPLTLAVIPRVVAGDWNDPASKTVLPLGEEKLTFLRNALATGEIEVAAHGETHGKLAEAPDGESSEYLGVLPAAQCASIERAKHTLEQALQTTVTSFVPPQNRYDAATVRCLEQAGITVLSSDLTGSGAASASLRIVPYLVRKDTQIEAALGAARKQVADHAVIVWMMHADDFFDHSGATSHASLKNLANRLSALAAQPDIQFAFLSQLAQRSDYSARRTYNYSQTAHSLSYRVAPEFLRFFYWPKFSFPSEERIQWVAAWAPLFASMFYLTTIALSCFTVVWLGRLAWPIRLLAWCAAAAGLLYVESYASWFTHSFRDAFVPREADRPVYALVLCCILVGLALGNGLRRLRSRTSSNPIVIQDRAQPGVNVGLET